MNQEPDFSRLSIEESLEDVERLRKAAQSEGLDSPEALRSIEDIRTMEELLQETGAYLPVMPEDKNINRSPESNIEPSVPEEEYKKSFLDHIHGSKLPHEPGDEMVKIGEKSFIFHYEAPQSKLNDPSDTQLDPVNGLKQQFYQKVFIRGKYNGGYKEIIRHNILLDEKYSWENIKIDPNQDVRYPDPQLLLNGQLEIEFIYKTEHQDSKKSFHSNNKLTYQADTKDIYLSKSKSKPGIYKTFSVDAPFGRVDRKFLMWCPGEPIPTLSDSEDTERIRKLSIEHGENLTAVETEIQKNLSEKIVEICDFDIYQMRWTRFIEAEKIGSHSFHPQGRGHSENFSSPMIKFKLSSPWVDGEQNEEKYIKISEMNREELMKGAHELAHELIDNYKFVLSDLKREELKRAFVEEMMRQMPEFSEESEMWIIDPKIDIHNPQFKDRISKISYGKTILKKSFTGSEVSSVILKKDAQRINLEGVPADGTIMVWWEHQVDEIYPRKELTLKKNTEIRGEYKDNEVFTITLSKNDFSKIYYDYSKKTDYAYVDLLLPVNIYEVSSWIDDDGTEMSEERLTDQDNRRVKRMSKIPETVAKIFEDASSVSLKVLIEKGGPNPDILLCTSNYLDALNQKQEDKLKNRKEDLAKIMKDGEGLKESAVEIPQSDRFEGMSDDQIPPENRIYGAPILNSDNQVVWSLFMRKYPDPEIDPQAWLLIPFKGYRSKSTGSSLEGLVNEYYRGEYTENIRKRTLMDLKDVLKSTSNNLSIKYLDVIKLVNSIHDY